PVAALHTIPLTDPSDERLADYVSLTDVALRSRHEPAKGRYIAESSTAPGRALAAGPRPRSGLLAPRWRAALQALGAAPPGAVHACEGADGRPPVPVYVAEPAVLEAITGFHVHRGALASMHRPALTPVADLLASARGGAGARRVAVLDGIVDHTNVGAAMRG